MKTISRIFGISALVLLGACSSDKSAPDIASGSGDLKYVVSSNILDSDKKATLLSRADSISIVFADSIAELQVKVYGDQGMVPVTVTKAQDGKEVIIKSGSGIWEDSKYEISITGTLANGTPVSFSIVVARELGLGVLNSNVYNIEKSVGYQDIASDLEAITVEYDRDIEKVSSVRFVVGNTEVATNVTIKGNVVSVDPEGAEIGYNKSCMLSMTAQTADSQVVSIQHTFKTAGSALVPVATNAEIVESSVGQLVTDFPVDGELWVKFNDSLDTDLSKIVWKTAGSASFSLYAFGSVSDINAIATIKGDTLKVKPKEILKNVDNNMIVGFKVIVVSKKNLTHELEVIAHVEGNQVHVISTNVQQDNGLYRAFKVIGDTLKVTFSEAIVTDSTASTRFRVNGFVKNYKVNWSKDKKTANIINIDTLPSATFGGTDPYLLNSLTTTAFDSVFFNLTTVDGEEALVAPKAKIQVHTEFGLAIVNSNILHKHMSSEIPVADNEDAKDTMSASGSITITFNRAIDTAMVKSATPNTYFMLYKVGEKDVALPITLSFSKDAKTVTVDPETDLEARNAGYLIRVIKVPGKGIAYAPASGDHAGSASGPGAIVGDGYDDLLTENALKVYYKSVDISKLKATIAVDTVSSADAIFSPGFVYGNNSDDNLNLQITKPAWNANHRDSVDGYQLRIQKISRSKVASGWYYMADTISTQNYNTSEFASASSNPKKMSVDLDLSEDKFFNNLRTADKDGEGSDYSNDSAFFNDSTRIEIQIRPVNDDDGDGFFTSAGEVGAWSTSLILKDNMAPCSQKWAVDVADATKGGATVNNKGFDDDFDGTAGGTVKFTVEITFAEDMTVSASNKPQVHIFWATKPALANMPKLNDTESKWISGRTYRVVYDFDGDVDYTSAGGYWAADVEDVLDGSGIAIEGWGDTGDAPEGNIAIGSVDDPDLGSRNVIGLQPL